jgi:uncharacterized protein YyaL (SSP411 family)
MLNALDEHLGPGELVVIRGSADAVAAWSEALAVDYAPRRMIVAIPANAHGLPEALSAKAARGSTVAYVCRGPQCSEPIADLPRLIRELNPP